MGTTYTVTNDFTVNTTAVADQVDANFTDILNAINALDAGNLASGTVALARISGLTSTQCASDFFKDEDSFASASATNVYSGESIKAYVDGLATFSPATYTGGESITFPNGLIIKQGKTTRSGNDQTITFATPFPTECTNVYVTAGDDAGTVAYATAVDTLVKASFAVHNDTAGLNRYHWFAIGY